MLGRQTHIFAANHTFDRTDIPIFEQKEVHRKQTIIEDDFGLVCVLLFC